MTLILIMIMIMILLNTGRKKPYMESLLGRRQLQLERMLKNVFVVVVVCFVF